MPEPEKRVCSICGGGGFLYHEETDISELCRCKIAEMMLRHLCQTCGDKLGMAIARATTITKSPLFVLPDKSGEPFILDRTTENLHIKCVWVDLLSHLKLCLWSKGLISRFRIVTDENIKSVFLGNESYKYRAKGKRDDIKTFNSLSDLVGDEYEFVIIRLGQLGYKNIAAAGAVQEALMIRDAAQRPTWIIEEPASGAFKPGHHTWSEELQWFIDQHFKVIDMQREGDDRVFEQHGYQGAEDITGGVEDVSPSSPAVRPVRAPRRETEISTDDFDLGPLTDSKPKWGNKSGWKPKKGGGGGPV
jgi:hypothetical protein